MAAERREAAYYNLPYNEPEEKAVVPRRPIGGAILRGLMIATVGLVGVFFFIRFEDPAPNPAWTPTEAEGMKIGVTSADKGSDPKPPQAPVAQNPAESAKKAPAGSTPRRIKPAAAAPASNPQMAGWKTTFPPQPATAGSEPEPTPAPTRAAPAPPASGDNAGDDLEAAPPPPGQTASGRKAEDDKPLHKRLFRAVGKIFKKKTDSKVEPATHNPQ